MPKRRLFYSKENIIMCIDKEVSPLANELKALGYESFCYEARVNYRNIHKRLNKDNVDLFITSNFKRYAYFPGSKYIVLGLSKKLIQNNTMKAIAEAIHCYLEAQLKYSNRVLGYNVELDSNQFYSRGCRQVKK
jgi:hypothetical protein